MVKCFQNHCCLWKSIDRNFCLLDTKCLSKCYNIGKSTFTLAIIIYIIIRLCVKNDDDNNGVCIHERVDKALSYLNGKSKWKKE